MKDAEKYKVSVILLTYGHERYIAQSIKSILSQKTDFNVQLIIINDCSPDSSIDIIGQFNRQIINNIHINFITNSENLGATRSWALGLSMASGEYITTIEGDDYWTDIEKLNKQVSFLELNPGYIGVSHKVKTVSESGEELPELYDWRNIVGRISLEEYLRDRTYSNISCLYKNVFTTDDLFILTRVHRMIGEQTMGIILLKKGDIFTIDEYMSAYRYVSREGNYNYNSLRDRQKQLYDRMLVINNLINEYPELDFERKKTQIASAYIFIAIKEGWLVKYFKEIAKNKIVLPVLLCVIVRLKKIFFAALDKVYTK